MDMIPIFSLQTQTGEFQIEVSRSAFEVTYELPGNVYVLLNDQFPSFSVAYDDPYKAILAVAQHRTGITEWDMSSEVASDYALDWIRYVDKRFQMRLLGDYLKVRPKTSMREMVDYFEQRHNYFIDRLVIKDLMTELITTGQIQQLPSMHCAPAELDGLDRIAAHWLLD